MATATTSAARTKRGKRLTYNVTSASTHSARKIILKGLIEYNRQKAGPAKWHTVAVVINDSRGRVLGGLSGWTGWDWMHIELFWLPEELRHQGHGRKLMQLAEAEARKRGCIGIYLNTASFQAPDFYPRLGFKALAAIDDFPPGHKMFYLVKRFD
jgi:GNAT superfamily N-acetyltransferase